MEEELKRETEEEKTMPNQAVYDVYKTATGLYVAEEVCQMYNVGDKGEYKNIKDHLCYKVNEKDLEYIEKQSSYQEMKLVPNIVTIFDLQLVLSFTVYIDKMHDNKLYILNNLCTKYNIKAISKRIIEGATYCNVTENDIAAIEEATKKEKIILKRKYIEISLEDEIKPAEYLFIYYYDYESKKSYIRRDMYDLATRNGITVEGEPKIISGKNCYSITENELKNIEIQLGYRGIEQLLRPAFHMTVPPQEAINNAINKLEEIDIQPPEEEVVEETKIEFPIEEPKEEVEEPVKQLVLVYQDKRTNVVYIPTDFVSPRDNQITTIMHKDCYISDIADLAELQDMRVVVAPVFPIDKKTYDILLCNNNGQLFVSQQILEDLGFYIEDPHRIVINKEIYEEITEADVELIEGKESDNCHINIIVKQIAPKRG